MVIIIKNVEKFQHYSRRQPPWIKLYRTLIDDCTFNQLSDASKWLAIQLWLLASEYEKSTIDDDENQIIFRLRTTKENLSIGLNDLTAAGFIICNSGC